MCMCCLIECVFAETEEMKGYEEMTTTHIKCLGRSTFLRATLPQAGKLLLTWRSSVHLGSRNSRGRSSRGRSHRSWRGRCRHRSWGCSCRLRRRLLLRDRCRHRSCICRSRSSCVVVGCVILVFRHCAKTDFLSFSWEQRRMKGGYQRKLTAMNLVPHHRERKREG
jgi:hypothetical protein